jgi:predicted CXXCH cytochrome family protein
MFLRRALVAFVAAACSCALAAAYAGTTRPGAGPPVSSPLPEIKKDCSLCHTPEGALKGGELKNALPQLCLDCHQDRTSPSEHKVDIIPSMDVKDLPLFDGKITCVTCHDPHGNINGRLLRMPAKKLCLVCHPA